MGYFPLIFMTIIFDKIELLPSRIIGLWGHIIFILVGYYSYTYFITCKSVLLVDILLFAICCTVGYFIEKIFIPYNNLFTIITSTILSTIIIVLSYMEHDASINEETYYFATFPDNPWFDMFEDKTITKRYLCYCSDPYKKKLD